MIKFIQLSLIMMSILTTNINATSRIYLIRHAPVQIEKPGWGTTETANKYREQYNINSVHEYDAREVLDKINHPETVETVFCSPQLRAFQTAVLLFNNQVSLKINSNLMELDYSVINVPFIKLPVNAWLAISWFSWVAGNNPDKKQTYRERKEKLEIYSDEIITYAETHGKSVVVAHGMINRELIKILQKKGWKFENKDGNGNLAVNCLVK